MRLLSCLPLVVLALLCSVACPAAENAPEPMLSFQGFTGLLNTPDARVTPEGTLQLLYTDQRENIWRSDRRTRDRRMTQDNYLLSVGLFNFIEIGGRLTEAPGRARDLSASFKITSAHLTKDHSYWPVVAFGMQDVGGEVSLIQSRYLAVSEEFWRLRITAGYGFQSGRMQGGFGGAEFKLHDWVTVLGEYDTRDTSAGLRLITPTLPWIPARLTFTAKSNLSHPSGLDLAFGLTVPLDMKQPAPSPPVTAPDQGQQAQPPGAGAGPAVAPLPAAQPPAATSGVRSGADPAKPAATPGSQPVSRHEQLTALRSRLIEAGFANVRVGAAGDTVLVVEYENVRYNHNELDALGVVAGVACSSGLEGVDTLRLVVKRKGLRMLLVSAPFREMRDWLSDASNGPAPGMSVETDTSSVDAARFIDGDSNPDWLKPSLIVFPGLKTFVGTEVGVFDYQLSIKPDLQVTVWKGGVLNARWDLPVAWSDNLERGRSYAYAHNDPIMDRLMLFQGVSLAPGLLANLGAGMIQHEIYGTLNELTWRPGNGSNGFRVVQAFAKNDANHNNSITNVWLGSYRRYLSSLDLFLEGTAGRFWGQDTGALVSIKRFFGDTAVELFYKSTETVENRHLQAAGIRFSFPLTPRRDMKRDPVQLRGADEWDYGQETLVNNGYGKNYTISSALGVNPTPSPDIYRSYLNRDRLNSDYILSHEQRIKESWRTFRDNLASPWPAL